MWQAQISKYRTETDGLLASWADVVMKIDGDRDADLTAADIEAQLDQK